MDDSVRRWIFVRDLISSQGNFKKDDEIRLYRGLFYYNNYLCGAPLQRFLNMLIEKEIKEPFYLKELQVYKNELS